MSSPVVCTIVARNYLAQARVLARSFADHHLGERLQVLVIDDVAGDCCHRDEPFDVLGPADLVLGLRDMHEMALYYDVMELATALKPSLLLTLLERFGGRPVVYLDPDVMVFSPLDDLTDLVERHPIVLTPHTTKPMARDTMKPSEFDILASGSWNLGFAAVGRDATAFLEWWALRLKLDAAVDHANMRFTDQRWVDLAPGYFDVHPLRDPGYNVAYWNLDQRALSWTRDRFEVDGRPLVFFHFSGFDPRRPHILSKHQGDRPRVRLSEHRGVARICRLYAERLAAEGWEQTRSNPYAWLELPDGTPVSSAMRAAVRHALQDRDAGGDCERPPDPFDGDQLGAFFTWLATPEPYQEAAPEVPRLFFEIHAERPDLQRAYPDIASIDAARYRDWVWQFGRSEEKLPPAVVQTAFEDGAWALPFDTNWASKSRLRPGFLVAGYLKAELGLGEAARRSLQTMRSAGLPCAAFAYGLTQSRQRHPHPSEAPRAIDLDTNVVWVNHDQLGFFVRGVGSGFFEGRYTVGSWAWETETPHPSMHEMSRYVDEIWTLSDFSRRCIQSVTDKPVFTFAPVIFEPHKDAGPSPVDLGLPGGFVFLFMFDFFSTLERKNPAGVVDAFCQAFQPGEGPTLVLKSINGAKVPLEMERLRYQFAGRSDILHIDSYLSAPQCAAMIARADCYVSLHRAEGFGLTMADAMAIGTPVIATGYSGNLEFMSDETAFLVPVTPVRSGPDALPYPEGSLWGEPDIAVASELMRRVYQAPDEAVRKAAVARRSVLLDHGQAKATRFLAERFGVIHEHLRSGFESPVASLVADLIDSDRQSASGRR